MIFTKIILKLYARSTGERKILNDHRNVECDRSELQYFSNLFDIYPQIFIALFSFYFYLYCLGLVSGIYRVNGKRFWNDGSLEFMTFFMFSSMFPLWHTA